MMERKKVLIVDERNLIAVELMEALKRKGYDVIMATSTDENAGDGFSHITYVTTQFDRDAIHGLRTRHPEFRLFIYLPNPLAQNSEEEITGSGAFSVPMPQYIHELADMVTR